MNNLSSLARQVFTFLIDSEEFVTQRAIADHIGCPTRYLSSTLKNLLRRGYARRKRVNRGGRSVYIYWPSTKFAKQPFMNKISSLEREKFELEKQLKAQKKMYFDLLNEAWKLRDELTKSEAVLGIMEESIFAENG